MARVKIVKLPKALSGLEIKMQPGLYGTNGNRQFNRSAHLEAGKISQQPVEVRDTLQPVDREEANLEAEKGETAVVNVEGMPAHFKIGGKRHSQGGTPLNLPDNSFIFSDTAKMKIKDPQILAQFGMKPKRGGYTPAEIAKKYDINKFRKVLADPNSEDLERKTAEMMIANYNEKLAKLSLAQESVKGFPQGIPVIAMPYIDTMSMDASTFLPDQAEEQLEGAEQPDAETGESRYGSQVISQFPTKKYGGLPKAQKGKGIYSTTGSKLMESQTPQEPGGFLGVGTGFSGDEALEKKWSEDSDVGPYYRKYKEALRSNNPKAMLEAARVIDSADIPGFQWWPGYGQNKLTDFSQILKEEAGKIINKYTPKKSSAESLDINLRKQSSDTFAKVLSLKNKARQAGDTDLEIFYDDELKKLHKLHPDYKGEHFWRQKQKSAGIPGRYNYEDVSQQPAIYYNEQEGNDIADLYNKYFPQETKKKEDTKGKTIDKQNKPASDTVKVNVASFLKEGGQLSKFEDGGKPTVEQASDGSTKTTYPDGKVEIKDATGKLIKTTPAPTKKDQSGTKGTKIPVGEYEAYPGYTEEELKGLLEDPSVLRYEKVKGKQKEGTKGVFGTGVSLEEFKARNPEYIKKFKEKYNKDFTEADAETFQKEYTDHVKDLAYKRAIEAGYTEAEAKEASERFAKSQGFLEGAPQAGDPRYIDKKFGEYTSSRFEPIFKKKAAPATIETKKEAPPAERGPVKRYPPIDLGQKTYAPWWLQDIVKTSGAAADLARVKRYLPWQAVPETRLPEATFYDPTRELAANAEQANIQTQAAAAFTGPQALSARSAAIQGQAAKNAADIMARYNNMNVQLANQLSQERTAIMNQAAQNKANLDTNLYDKYTVANQQFDNAKNMARQNLRQSYIDAITNRAKTQALNTLYPNFYTDPITGGFVNKTGYASITPTPQGSSEMDQVQKIMERFPGTSAKDAYDIIRKGRGSDSSTSGEAEEYRRAQGYI